MKKTLWLAGLCGLLAQTLPARDFFVIPSGDDAHPGTRQEPLATIQAARDAVRAHIAGGMTRDITVFIGPGDYFIDEPLLLDARDSGRDGFTITYRGTPGLRSRIYGGRPVTGWQPHGEDEYVAVVPGLQHHYTLYENEQAANGGIFHTFHGAPEGNWRKEGDRLIYHPRHRPIEDQLIVLGTAKRVFEIHGASMTEIAGNLVFDGLHMIGSDFAHEWKRGDSYSTTWDGEYDGRPWGGASLADSVIAPDMRHGQFYIENARNVVIQNSRLYGAGFMGVMFNRWAQDCRVENNWIENAGCNGLFFMGWEPGRGPFDSPEAAYVNKRHVVRNNVFYDIGRFSNFASGMYFNFSGDNLVEHNVFHGITHYGVTLKGWPPTLLNKFYSINQDLGIATDDIRQFDMEEIRLYGTYVVTEANQGAAVNHSRNNIIRYNDMSQIARFGDDMGMISMWGAGPNNQWNYNVLHDGVNASGWEHWLHVLFNDDASHKATLRGNLIYWITGGGRSRAIMSKGIDQTNLYNIIADCDLSAAATIGPFTESAHNMVWSHNIVAAQIGGLYEGGHGTQHFGGEPQPILKEANHNLYFYAPLGPHEGAEEHHQRIRQQVEGQRQGGRFETDSLYADPRFDRQRPWWDAHYTDYRLKPDSPAHDLGFQETDMDRIGLQAGFPFDLVEIIGHPANKTRKAADFSRIYLNRITNQEVRSRRGGPLYRDSWVRYNWIDFEDGDYHQFRTRVQWVAPRQTFEKDVEGSTISALELADVWIPHPYWEVSPAYTVAGKTGPELFDVPFAPEEDPESVAWKAIIEPLRSRLTVEYPLGVVNLDVANGEENAQSAAYMRSSLYAKGGGTTDIEIRGEHGVKLWVNGELVFSQLGGVNQSPRVNVRFERGWNEMLMKVVQDDQPWQPTEGRGNFWATVNIYYAALGGAFIVPGLPGKEVFVDPDKGTAVEIRLNAPDGELIGTLPFGETVCAVDAPAGRHDVFLVYPNANVQMMDWFRFE